MNVLVAGGAGYIGSHAVKQLLDAGHRVVAVDNLYRGHAAGGRSPGRLPQNRSGRHAGAGRRCWPNTRSTA